jgi:CheY-like chemotaxis protein
MSQTIPEQKPSAPHELTPRDDAKKIVSELLKRVDQLIRKGELDKAQQELEKAREIDPRNVYTLALEERISILRTEFALTQAPEQNAEASKPQVKEKIATSPVIPKPSAAIEDKLKSTKIPKPAPAVVPPTAPPISPDIPGQDHSREKSIEWETYRKALLDAWRDGALSEGEEQQLGELRKMLEISDGEHEIMTRGVRCECYKNALKRHLTTGGAFSASISALKDLRSTYHIAEDEHLKIESELLNASEHKQRDKILLIDDDARLLEALSLSLEEDGFDVTALTTSDEAYALLRKFVPDLILCDINLETSTMGGFTFYEKVKEFKSLQYTPFIFLTGLTDEALVRTGKELGVDDYLMKPISEQTLLSTLRGKLKRFKQLQKLAGYQPPQMPLRQ